MRGEAWEGPLLDAWCMTCRPRTACLPSHPLFQPHLEDHKVSPLPIVAHLTSAAICRLRSAPVSASMRCIMAEEAATVASRLLSTGLKAAHRTADSRFSVEIT